VEADLSRLDPERLRRGMIGSMNDPAERTRVDKWLWAARFVKTRGLAVEAVNGGRVEVNGQRVKPSKEIRAGDRLEITIGQVRTSVVVRGISARRGPASEAALLYEETAESREARERQAAERRLAAPDAELGGRPTKRDRRRFEAALRSRGRRLG
jgi:ribosome-associated heat shock protein Hsp15